MFTPSELLSTTGCLTVTPSVQQSRGLPARLAKAATAQLSTTLHGKRKSPNALGEGCNSATFDNLARKVLPTRLTKGLSARLAKAATAHLSTLRRPAHRAVRARFRMRAGPPTARPHGPPATLTREFELKKIDCTTSLPFSPSSPLPLPLPFSFFLPRSFSLSPFLPLSSSLPPLPLPLICSDDDARVPALSRSLSPPLSLPPSLPPSLSFSRSPSLALPPSLPPSPSLPLLPSDSQRRRRGIPCASTRGGSCGARRRSSASRRGGSTTPPAGSSR